MINSLNNQYFEHQIFENKTLATLGTKGTLATLGTETIYAMSLSLLSLSPLSR